MALDRDTTVENFPGLIIKPISEENSKQVPIYVRGWCEKNCDSYGGCDWEKKNCHHYDTPQWMKKETKK